MAEGEKEKKFPVLLVVGMVIIGLLLASGISYFVATKIVADKGWDKQSSSREPGVFLKLGDPKDGLIINVGGISSGRYLKIGVILEMRPGKAAEAAGKGPTPDEVKILDTVVYVLRSQKIEDFDPAKQDRIKELIKTEVNKALGEDRVYEVYITNFVLQ